MNHTTNRRISSSVPLPLEIFSIDSVSKEDLLLINQLLLNLYRLKTRDEQAMATLEMLKTLVPSVLACWTHFNIVTRELQFTTLPNIPVPPEQTQKVAEVAHQSPFAIYFSISGDRSWRMLTDFMPTEDFQRTELCQRMLAPMGCVHMISTMLDKVGDDQFSLTLCRAEAYSERDRSVLNLVYPHLNLSYYNLQAYEKSLQSLQQYQTVIEQAPGGYAFVQPDGKITWATQKARELWRIHFPEDAANHAGVPTTVSTWLNKLLKIQAHILPTIENCLHRESPAGKLEMCLIPSPFEGLVLSVSSSRLTPQPRFRPLPELTLRQNDALQWMAEGKRNGEIATILGISERTVEKHVAEIMAHLHAENRATAIIRAMEHCAMLNLTEAR